MSTTLLDSIIEPFAECLTLDAAKKIVAVRADADTQARVDELADKANRGTLTPEEQADYDRYLAAFHFVTIMQARRATSSSVVNGDNCRWRRCLMIELTNEQWKRIEKEAEIPPRVIDPSTLAKYVLVREEVYERIKRVFEAGDDSQFVDDMTPHVMEIFGRDGWDDPSMDIYNDLDPRNQP